MVLGLISLLLKTQFPINSPEQMNDLKNTIEHQNKVTHDLKSRLDYYKIWNPIYNDYNYTIL